MNDAHKILLIYGPRLDIFKNLPRFLINTPLFSKGPMESVLENEVLIWGRDNFLVPISNLDPFAELDPEIFIVENIIDVFKTWNSVDKDVFKNIPPTYTEIVKGIIFSYEISKEIKVAEFHLIVKNTAETLSFHPSRNGKDDKDYENYLTPFVFKPPSPPEDMGVASNVQLNVPLKEVNPDDENYCQYCGETLTEEEQFTHSCRKKPK